MKIVFCIFLMYYSSLAAELNDYSDLIILKSGTIFNRIHAENTTKGIQIKSRFKSRIFSRDKVAEIRKGICKEVIEKEGKEIYEIPENWGQFLGYTNQAAAIEKCEEECMRLPHLYEFKKAYKDGITKSWEKDGLWYWSSARRRRDMAYYYDISEGRELADLDVININVRCIRGGFRRDDLD